jgi:site-specific DNA recombinase
MTRHAVIYARVSTVKQADADLSIPDQLRACEAYCQQHGWPVVAQYIDPGASATDDNRPEFQRMVDDSVRGVPGFDFIVVHSQSRFMRDAFLAELYRRKLRKVSVEVISVTQDFGEGASADMMRQMIGLFDEFTSKEIAKHVLRTMLENARKGFVNGKAPFGYRAVEAERRGEKVKKRLEIEPDEAEIVKLMFQLARVGPNSNDPMGVKEIAKELCRRNLTKRNGRPFSFPEVHKILSSPTYIGRYVFNMTNSRTGEKKPPDQWVIMTIPAIVDEVTFEAVQAAMRKRDPMKVSARFTGHPTLLSNLARCGNCGAAMTLGTGKSGRYRYYVCSRKNREGEAGCRGRRIPERLLDDLVIGHLAEVLFVPEHLRAVLDDAIKAERAEQDNAPRQLDGLIRRKSDLEGRISRMHRAIELGTVEFDNADFTDRLKGLKGERAEVELAIASLRNATTQFPPLTPVRLQAFGGALCVALRNGEARTRRAYLKYFLERVIVHNREIRLVGHKGKIAEAYALDWQTEALKAGSLRRSLPSVPGEVTEGLPPSLNGRSAIIKKMLDITKSTSGGCTARPEIPQSG